MRGVKLVSEYCGFPQWVRVSRNDLCPVQSPGASLRGEQAAPLRKALREGLWNLLEWYQAPQSAPDTRRWTSCELHVPLSRKFDVGPSRRLRPEHAGCKRGIDNGGTHGFALQAFTGIPDITVYFNYEGMMKKPSYFPAVCHSVIVVTVQRLNGDGKEMICSS